MRDTIDPQELSKFLFSTYIKLIYSTPQKQSHALVKARKNSARSSSASKTKQKRIALSTSDVSFNTSPGKRTCAHNLCSRGVCNDFVRICSLAELKNLTVVIIGPDMHIKTSLIFGCARLISMIRGRYYLLRWIRLYVVCFRVEMLSETHIPRIGRYRRNGIEQTAGFGL